MGWTEEISKPESQYEQDFPPSMSSRLIVGAFSFLSIRHKKSKNVKLPPVTGRAGLYGYEMLRIRVQVRCRVLPDCLRSSRSGMGSTQPREYN
jgi:hypothetical protein